MVRDRGRRELPSPQRPLADARSTPARTLAMLAAAQLEIVAELSVRGALACVVRHACALTGASHGVARVVAPDGVLELVVPADVVADHVTAVDIRLHGETLGSLQISGAPAGRQSENLEILEFLTATAALVIENFRLTVDVERRERWLRASGEITRDLLVRGNDHALRDIARRLKELIDADAVTVVLQVEGRDRMRVDVALVPGGDGVIGQEYPSRETLSHAIIETGEPVRLADAEEVIGPEVRVGDGLRLGPILGLPLIVAGRPRGAIVAGRLQGRAPFTLSDLDRGSAFAGQAALALELVDTRQAQDRIALWEDRSRIARDLHDVVIQQLFATGLTVRGLIRPDTGATGSQALEHVVDELDDAIGQIRTSIFALHHEAEAGTRSVVLDTVAGLAAVLGRAPIVRFSGPVDSLIPEAQHPEIRAVLGESLTNVARHAHADRVAVGVAVIDGWLRIEVIDDGVGMDGATRDSGLANLRSRAADLGGRMVLESSAGTGTTLLWTVPLDR